jgi:hypothetical protein
MSEMIERTRQAHERAMESLREGINDLRNRDLSDAIEKIDENVIYLSAPKEPATIVDVDYEVVEEVDADDLVEITDRVRDLHQRTGFDKEEANVMMDIIVQHPKAAADPNDEKNVFEASFAEDISKVLNKQLKHATSKNNKDQAEVVSTCIDLVNNMATSISSKDKISVSEINIIESAMKRLAKAVRALKNSELKDKFNATAAALNGMMHDREGRESPKNNEKALKSFKAVKGNLMAGLTRDDIISNHGTEYWAQSKQYHQMFMKYVSEIEDSVTADNLQQKINELKDLTVRAREDMLPAIINVV